MFKWFLEVQQEQIFISNPFSNVLVLAGRELIFFTEDVLWIYVQNSADNTGMFSLLLSSACTEPRSFSAPHPTPTTKRMRVHSQRRHSWDSQSQLTHGISQRCQAQHIKLRGRRRGAVCHTNSSLVCWSPALLETAEHLPACGKQ